MTRSTTKIGLLNGKRLRITRLDSCGRVVYGDNNVAISSGFVSIAAKAVTSATTAVDLKNANGDSVVKDSATTSFSDYTLDITFAEVDPELFALVTGQSVRYDANGNVIGFSVNSDVTLDGQGIAIEVWTGSPSGDACNDVGAQGSFGYVLYPFVQGGYLSDHTIAEGGITFAISGASTQDGNGWGTGPYKVVLGSDGTTPSKLAAPLLANDHEVILITGVAPPAATVGTRPQLDPSATPVTAVTFAATTGHAGTITITGGGAGVGVQYDFGDGTWDYVTGTSTSHTFPAAGTYTVKASSNGTYVQTTATVA